MALDNPDLIVTCVVGDGEAETGPLATAWHSNKFINPERDGIVRRVPVVMDAQAGLVPSLTMEMLRVVSRAGAILIRTDQTGVRAVAVPGLEVPTDQNGQFWVHFNKHDPARYVSARDILNGSAPADRFRGRLVLIGTSAVADRNVISGNGRSDVAGSGSGVLIDTPGADTAQNNKVQSNYIGIKADGSGALGNAQDGVRILRGLAIALSLITLGLFALAIYLARGWRREAVRAVGFAFIVGYYGLPFVMSLYLQQQRGLSSLGAGLVLLPMMLIGLVLTPFSARIAERAGARLLVTGGLVVMAAGLAALAAVPAMSAARSGIGS